MLSSPRRPDTTIRIFSSAVYCLRVLRRISRTVLSAGSFLLINFCLIFVPFGHYDEPEILRYAITSICPKGADVRHFQMDLIQGKGQVDWFNNRRLLEPIGNIPPAEAEERHYAMLEQSDMAA